jgi:hypothetical protein
VAACRSIVSARPRKLDIAFPLDQKGRIDPTSGIIERDDEVEIAVWRRNPTIGQAILKRGIPGSGRRTRFSQCVLAAWLSLPVRRLQRQTRHHVTGLVTVPLQQKLVKARPWGRVITRDIA